MRKLLIASATMLTLTLAPTPAAASSVSVSARAALLYEQLGLEGALDRVTFETALARAVQQRAQPHMLAIADMSQPSTVQRFFVIDLLAKRVVMRTWVAHGQNSGSLFATKFSNTDESHQTSLGLYSVGQRIVSPKHGPALLLNGLDKGVNDKALSREIIVHGADYVSEKFIKANGRLGRSWGCPALPRDEMARAIALLANGGLLYIHGA